MSIISPGQATAVGNALIPPEGPAAVPFVLDFSAASVYTVDVGMMMQKGAGYPGLSVLQTLFVDNSANASALTVTVADTLQKIVAAPETQGYYPLFSPMRGNISFASPGAVVVKAYLANVPIPPIVWGGATGGGGGGGIPEAPDDGQTYARQSDGWAAILGFPEAPDDGHLYARSDDAWTAFVPGIPDAPNNANAYNRKGGAWALATAGGGIPDAPDDGTTYGRNNGAWVAAGGGGGGAGFSLPYGPPGADNLPTVIGTPTSITDVANFGTVLDCGAGIGTVQLSGYAQAAPGSAAWTVTARVLATLFPGNYATAGIVLIDGAGRYITFGNSNNSLMKIDRWNPGQGFNSETISYPTSYIEMLQIHYDGANLTYSASRDGVNFNALLQESATAFLGPVTEIGLFSLLQFEAVGGSHSVLTCPYWQVTED